MSGADEAGWTFGFAFAWRRSTLLLVVFLTCLVGLRAAPPDKQAPTVPTNLVASAVAITGFTVSWSASTDNVGVTGYEILFGSASQGAVAVTSRSFSGVQPGTTYSVTVRARDAAGNWSAQSPPLAITTAVDSSPPTVPAGLVASSVTSSSFVLNWNASTDNVGVTSYEVFLGGVSQGIATTASKSVIGLQSLSVYSVTVRAKDGAGNWSAQSLTLSVTTTSDTIAPSVPTGLVANNVTANSFTVSWNSSTDNGGVANYEVFLNGSSQGMLAATSKSLIGLQPSTAYSVTVKAQDNAGNWSALSSPLTVTSSVNLGINPMIAAGNAHTVFLSAEGRIWMWGINDLGQFGNGTLVSSSAPVLVNGWGTVKQVGVGDRFTVALRVDGTVWSSGRGDLGGLGNGSTVNKSNPVQVTGLSSVVAIAVSSVGAYALKSDGTVWAWGYNTNGEIGDGTTTLRSNPVRVQGLSGISSIAAGWTFGLALGADGRVWRWGINIGNSGYNVLPVQIAGLPIVQKIAALSSDAMALDNAGQVWAWGHNNYGELGDGTTTKRGAPAIISGLPAVTKIFGGSGSACAAILTATNQVYVWGRNDYGQAKPPAQGTGSFISTPQLFPELGVIVEKSSSFVASYCIQANGILKSWGGAPVSDIRLANANVLLGSVPIPLSAQASFAQIAFGSHHGLLIDQTGNLWSIGENESGQLGDGTTIPRVAVQKIPSPSNVVQVIANEQASGGLTADGKLWLWGDNWSGLIGDGTVNDRSAPFSVPGLGTVRGFDIGTGHTLAVLANGEVWAWGYNFWSQLGFTPGSGIYNYPAPRKVTGISTAIGVAAGPSHSLALLADGTVLQWGITLTTTETATPTVVSRLSGVKKVAAGESFSIALLQGGTVSAWGRNDVGQLGNGSTTNSTRPVQVSGLTNIVDVAVYSGAGAFALRNDGTVWVWGGGNNLSPVRVGTISDVRAIGGRSGTNIGLIRGNATAWISGGSFVYVETPATDLVYQVVDVRALAASNDADNDGLPDQWEITYFGNLNQKAGDDFDGDGESNAQEYILGTNPALIDSDGDLIPDWLDEFPLSFFNEVVPSLTILGGDNQGSAPGAFNTAPFEVSVWDAVKFVPIVNAPVNWSITQGAGALSLNPNGSAFVSSLSVTTDLDGTARVYFKQPSGPAVVSKISATTGPAQVIFTTSNSVDSDGDGLTDSEEAILGTNPNNPDSDGDGSDDFAEYRVGRNPLAGVLPGDGAALNLVVLQPSN